MSETPVEPNPMEESILDSIKKALNIPADYHAFDPEIIMHINSVLSNLIQIGVGPRAGFAITGSTQKWGDFLIQDAHYLNAKTYVYLKVRLVFDPPNTPHTISAFEKIIAENEFRLNVDGESINWVPPVAVVVTDEEVL